MNNKRMNELSIKGKIALVVVLLILSCLVGYMLLVMAYGIPTDYMKGNMSESAGIIKTEGRYFRTMNRENSQLDNYTDSLMLLTASHPTTENAWKGAINVSRYYRSDKKPDEVLVDKYLGKGKGYSEVQYSRYWHGYLVFLKPLIALFDYGTIRYLLMFLQIGLFALLVSKSSTINKRLIFPIIFLWIFLNPVSTMMSLQFGSVTIITFCAMLFILCKSRKWQENLFLWNIFFMFVGIITSYMDLLTFPLITLGVPLTLWVCMYQRDKVKGDIMNIVEKSFFWAVGYGGMWALKWLLGSIITGQNIIRNAFDTIEVRTSSSAAKEKINFVNVLYREFKASYQIGVVIALIILIVIFVITLYKTRHIKVNNIIPYAIMACYPIAWYVLIQNHSYIHYWFAYRELAISVFAVSLCIMMLMRKENYGQDCSFNTML